MPQSQPLQPGPAAGQGFSLALPDEAVVERIDGDPGVGLLLLCDHASNAIPPEFGNLGLPAEQLSRHIAYDIGAAAVTRSLARRLGAPALLTRTSRLVIDPNRGADDPTLVMRLSDGAIVPGNARIDADGIAERVARFHRPYHEAIRGALDAMLADGVVPIVLAVHSFTPFWRGVPRPWHVTLLWDVDPRIAQPMIRHFADDPALVAGDNEPYDGCLEGDTMYTHATARGLPHALVEIRQDLIADAAGQEEWAGRLEAALKPLLADAELHQVRHYGSRAGR